MNSNIAKELAAKTAVNLVKEGMVVGLGTGSTTAFFIAHLGEKCRQGLQIKAVPTSQQSLELALVSNIPIANANETLAIDLTVDGADEVDPRKRMIKGAGGALLREKIVANISKELVIIIDESKLVKNLGKVPLPVEIVPFAFQSTIHKLEVLGYKGIIRKTKKGKTFITENNNYIFDVHLSYPCTNPEEIDREIRSMTGVVETGFFLNLAGRVIIGYKDGNVEVMGNVI